MNSCPLSLMIRGGVVGGSRRVMAGAALRTPLREESVPVSMMLPQSRLPGLAASGAARRTPPWCQGDSAAPISNRDVIAVVGIVTL
jgi:hypothetical protein